MTGSRSLAVRILRDRTQKGSSLDRLFQSHRFVDLPSRDQRLTREIVQGVFRNLSLLDFFIASRSKRPLSRIDQIVVWILRVSIYQIKFMRIPDYASLHEAGKLCKKFKKSSAQSFVNGILRGLLRDWPALPEGSSPEALATRYSHPEWLVVRYISRFGDAMTERILKRNNEIPDSVLWINPFKTTVESFLEELDQEKIPYELLSDVPNAVRIVAQRLPEHRLYREGHCFLMDASSQKIAQLCDVDGHRLVGDLCAAPGGKSFLMADRVEPGSQIFCSDVDFGRLKQAMTRARLYGVPGLCFVQMDLEMPALHASRFDSLLVDVPCSGTGTLRTNPDARWRIAESELVGLHAKQVTLLENAFKILRPGGELIYSTCSTEPEENEEVVEEFLDSEVSSELLGDYFTTFPTQEQGEGFFAARVRRI